jgi:Putative zinc-finger
MNMMDHTEAVRLQAAEKYLLGELSKEQREEYEEHYFSCAECAEELKTTVVFAEGTRQVFRDEGQETIAAQQKGRAKNGWFAWLRPAVAIPVFAALLLVIGYQNILTIPGLKEANSRAAAVRVVQSFSLLSVRAAGAGSMTIRVRPDEGYGLEVDIPPTSSAAGYVCQVQDEAGQTRVTLMVSADEAKRTVHVNVPGGSLPAGKYAFVVYRDQAPKVPTDKSSEVARLPFAVEFLR